MSKVQQYFKDYPTKTACFETADGTIFHQIGDANLHAASLKNNEVVCHKAVADKAPVPKVEKTERQLAEEKVAQLQTRLQNAKDEKAKDKVQKELDTANAALKALVEADANAPGTGTGDNGAE